ncbi:MAG: HEAT repeat domain-containing protein [Planctomycetota bacterium]|nr:HEAT repeat domain-containing protein [Planctomycetota bacterium]
MSLVQRLQFTTLFLTVAISSLSPVRAGESLDSLHAVLRSDASLHDKGVACRRLAVIGDRQSIPVLAELLSDKALSQFARTGLEAIPDPAVDEVFRAALSRVKGSQLIGVLNSIGNRRDSGAIGQLAELMKSGEPQIQSAAAAAALGRVGNTESAKRLHETLGGTAGPVRVAVADACLRCADLLFAEKHPKEAIALYDAVREGDTPLPLRTAATLSAIRSRGTDGVPLLREQLQCDDMRFFAVGLRAAREIPPEAAVSVLLAELNQRDEHRVALLVECLGDLGEPKARTAVEGLLDSKQPLIRRAAIGALGTLGDVSTVDSLLDIASSAEDRDAPLALASLRRLSGGEIDAALVGKLKTPDPPHHAQLLELVAARRIVSAVPLLWSGLESPTSQIRLSAWNALGETIEGDEFDELVSRVVSAPQAARSAAPTALVSACRRATNPDQYVNTLAKRFESAAPESAGTLFEALRAVGGEAALNRTVAGAKDKRDAIQDGATRALGEWPTPDVAPELLKLAESLTNSKYQIRAIRGYIRVFRQFGLPADERLKMARQALKVAKRNDEKVLVLHALLNFQNAETMNLSIEFLNEPGLEATAAQVAIYIADQVTDPVAVRTAMRKIIDSGADERYAKQARDVLAKVGE